MKKWPARLLLVLLFSAHSAIPPGEARGNAGAPGINPFRERAILVGEFENRGEPKHHDIGEILQTYVITYARTISTVALSDEERRFLLGLAEREEYKSALAEAGGVVLYTLSPVVARADPETPPQKSGTGFPFPLTVSGSYTVKSGGGSAQTVEIEARVHNGITGRFDVEFKTETTLASLLETPELFLVPFFKALLRYQTRTANIVAAPGDALIYVDGRLLGVGEVREVLLARGSHRLTVQRSGYRDFSTIFTVNEDGTAVRVELEKVRAARTVRIVSQPEGAQLYVDELYAGETPFVIELSGEDKVFTIVKEGYSSALLRSGDIPEGAEEFKISLVKPVTLEDVYAKAETHRKRASVFYGTAIGMFALMVILNTQKNLAEQEADLYRGVDDPRSNEADERANTLGYLTAASATATVGFFALSFTEIVKYFKLYDSGRKETRPRSKRG